MKCSLIRLRMATGLFCLFRFAGTRTAQKKKLIWNRVGTYVDKFGQISKLLGWGGNGVVIRNLLCLFVGEGVRLAFCHSTKFPDLHLNWLRVARSTGGNAENLEGKRTDLLSGFVV